jgi:hypothetical protein
MNSIVERLLDCPVKPGNDTANGDEASASHCLAAALANS